MSKKKIGCVIMASGLSARFGTNKLLQEFQGTTFIQRILDTTADDLFEKRVVVTRTKEVEEICKTQGVDVILHDFSRRNDVVRLGTEWLCDMKAVVFCPCDQPLLSRESLEKMVKDSDFQEDSILRLAFGDRQGTPILFGKKYFDELCDLPEKTGGSYLVKKYPQKVRFVLAKSEYELDDVDTPEDLKRLSEVAEKFDEEKME